MISIVPRLFAPLLVIFASLLAGPVAAQVKGVATSRTEVVLAQSKALQDAYRIIPQNFPEVGPKLRQLDEEYISLQNDLNALATTLSTATGKAVPSKDDIEMIRQAQLKNLQINTNREQHRSLAKGLTRAQMFVVEQLLQRLGQIQGSVAAAQSISVIMAQGGHVYESKDLQLPNLDSALAAELNRQLPAVRVVPPDGYEPNQQVQFMHQRVSAVFQALARQRAQAAQ